jgi:hypothetical protein
VPASSTVSVPCSTRWRASSPGTVEVERAGGRERRRHRGDDATEGGHLGLLVRPTFVVLGVAVVASIALYNPLENIWFPVNPEDVPLPMLGDATVAAEVVEPLDDNGTFTVRVTLQDATFGDNTASPTGTRPDDPETELSPRFQVGPVYLQPPIPEECAMAERCTEADFEMTLPSGFVSDPPESLLVELLTADRLPFAPPLQTRFDLEPSAG